MYKKALLINNLNKYLPNCLINYAISRYSKKMLKYLKKGFILSKILKEKYFWNGVFKTTFDTLDPRNDTETLIEVFLQHYNELNIDTKDKCKLMDMCCGTGAIGISLLTELPNLRGYFIDISHKAIQVCKHNIRYHKLWHKTKIIQLALEKTPNISVDFLVSNPPYLLKQEIKNNKILEQDPFISLYGGKDGLYFYKLLSIYIKNNVKYFACIEIDHYRKAEILNIFQQQNFSNISVFLDISGLARVLYIHI